MELFSFATIRLFLLIFARCVGTVWFAPILGGIKISRLNKHACAFLLSLLVFPSMMTRENLSGAYVWAYSGGACLVLALSIFFEFLLGATIGLFLKVFFQGVYLAGEMISRIGGVSVAESFDPSLGGETTAPASFLYWVSLAVFIACGGMERFLEGFLNYFSIVVPGTIVFSSELVAIFTQTLSSSFILGLRLSSPVILTTAIVYLGVGINGRLFSQMNLSAICFNVNAIITLILLFLCIGAFCQVFQSEITYFIEMVL